MNLYALKDLYMGKDMWDEMIVGYVIQTNDQGMFDYINTQLRYGSVSTTPG